jgi:hypothetical protein
MTIPSTDVSLEALQFTITITLKRRGVEAKLVAGDYKSGSDMVLMKALKKAHDWLDLVKAGTSIAKIAEDEGTTPAFIRTRTSLAFL